MKKPIEQEIENKRDAGLARALSTPHKPHAMKKKTKKKTTKAQKLKSLQML